FYFNFWCYCFDLYVGHTHYQLYCRYKDSHVYGDIPIYTSGALFEGDDYLIDVKGKYISLRLLIDWI
ncbi:hypothetical protein AB6H34_19230, partial [Proteus mirabilis]